MRTKSHVGKKSHKEIFHCFGFFGIYSKIAIFKCEKFTNLLYYISILCTLSLFHFHCQMKSSHSPVFFMITIYKIFKFYMIFMINFKSLWSIFKCFQYLRNTTNNRLDFSSCFFFLVGFFPRTGYPTGLPIKYKSKVEKKLVLFLYLLHKHEINIFRYI